MMDNRDRVRRGLDFLREGLVPFVERELEARLGVGWLAAVNDRRRREDRWEINRRSDGRVAWDNSTLLSVMLDWWDPIFARALGQPRREVDGLRRTRNAWAHEEPFSDGEAEKALNSMSSMLAAVGARAQAREVEKLSVGGAGPDANQGNGQRTEQMRPRGAPLAAAGATAGSRPGQKGAPNVGLYIGLAIFAFVVLAVFWQAAFGGSSAGDEEGGEGEGGQGEQAATDPAQAPAPDNLAFLCDWKTRGEDVSLSNAEKDEAQAAVEEFLTTAYGDPGADADAYENAVDSMVVGECFYASAAGGYAGDLEEVARAGGSGKASPYPQAGVHPAYATALVSFEVEGASQVTAEGGAEYVTLGGEAVWVAQDKNGKLVGRQETLSLARKSGEEEWRVVRGAIVPPALETKYKHPVEEKIEDIEAGASQAATQGTDDELTRAVEDYYAAVERRDWTYTYGALDSEARALFDKEEWEQKNQWFADNVSQELVSTDVDEGVSSDNMADATITWTLAEDGSEYSRETIFVHEDGEWKHRLTEEEKQIFMADSTFEEFVEAQEVG